MDKSIFKIQNNQFLLKCRAAHEKEYSIAKRANNFNFYLVIIFVIASIIASFISADIFSLFSTFGAICLLIITQHIDAYVKKHQGHAASIQQYCDVLLYSTVLKNKATEWGMVSTKTDLAETINGIEESEIGSVRNWYSDYSSLDPIRQVFYCQKENLHWDTQLRIEYKKYICVATLFGIIILIIASIINPSFVKFICTFNVGMPILDFGVKYYNRLNDDINRASILKNKSDLIERIMDECDSIKIQGKIIDLQYQIYKYRETVALIPDKFYKFKQLNYQRKEDQIADTLQNMCKKNVKNNNKK